MGKTQARRDKLKGASQSFNFKVIKFTAKITVCVRNRSRRQTMIDETEDKEKVLLNMGSDKKIMRG